MTPLEQYRRDMEERVAGYRANADLQAASRAFFEQIGVGKANYVYNFHWLGVPILQIPQDLQAMQEIIWQAKPDLIIETGVAWGGSLMFSASMLAILEACGEFEAGQVLGIDIEIRPHNRQAITSHPLARKITLLEGSSVDSAIVDQVKAIAKRHNRVLVCLDSNHTHDHVLAELEAYGPLVSPGSYCMVGDTIIEDAPEGMVSHRPWGKGDSPKSAVWEYLRRLAEEGRTDVHGQPLRFEIDRFIEDKILLTGSPDGYLKRPCR
ncbi:MAG: cephalosporin hydroxylase [Planctomycetes bacterium]|nr:cephalosporin hydroxylase [Planctomycetota bacterium]